MRPGHHSGNARLNLRSRIIMIILTAIFSGAGLAQNPAGAARLANKIKFERIGRGQGMRGSDIKCILQDRRGFMWFGTSRGLHRYDGNGFTVYRNDVRDATTISGDHILTIYEDQSDMLWIGTLINGLNRFDRASGKSARFVHDPAIPNSLSYNQVHAILEDRGGTLWIGTQEGLNRFDRERRRFTRFVHDPEDSSSLSGKSVFAIHESRDGNLWFATNNGLSRLDRSRNRFIHYRHDPNDPHSLSHSHVVRLHEDRHGNLWAGTMNGLNRFNRERTRFNRYLHDPGNTRSLSNNVIWAIHEDHSGTLWIGTEAGLNILDAIDGQFTRISHDPANPHSLSSNYVTAILEDGTGTLWVGTGNPWRRARGSGFGINRFDRGQDQFHHIIPPAAERYSQEDFPVHTVYEDLAGILWIGTARDGLYRLDRATGRYRRFVHDPENPRSLSQNFIMSIHEDRSGTLWVGTSDTGLNRFDRKQETFTRFAHDSSDSYSLSHNRVVSIHEDRSGNLWIATFGGGLNRFDRAHKKFIHFRHDPNNPLSLSSDRISFIHEDRAGTLWIATWDGGLNRFDREEERFTRFMHDPNDPASLSSNILWHIHEDRAGALWIATSGGLNKFERNSGRFMVYTEADGLPENIIFATLEDDRGRLWLSTSNGLSCFDPRGEQFRNFSVNDGLENTGYSFGAPCASRNGEIYMVGSMGIDCFHPESIRNNSDIPPVYITRLTHYIRSENGDTALVDNELSDKDRVAFAYASRNFSVDFAALNFRDPQQNQYAYQLEGAEEEWVHLGTRHSLTFTNLAPGSYTLRIKGSNNDGIWNEAGTSLKITILPPWWRTGWMYALYLLLAIALIYGIRRYELNRQRLKYDLELKNVEAQKLLEVDRLKSRLFAGISHEFRTPLTLIRGPVKQLISGEGKGNASELYEMILRNSNRLLRLVNQLLDLAKLESGGMKLQASPHDIVPLTRQLTMAFESLAKMRGIELIFNGPAEAVAIYLERRHYETIITNLLSNALKFTPEGGKILVKVATEQATNQPLTTDNCLLITIKDTGPGIPAADLPHIFDRFYQAGNTQVENARGSGIGLALVKELVELHHGSISVTSEMGKGTEFVLKLPLGKGHLKPEEIAEERGARSEERGAKSVERDAESKVWEDIEPAEPAISSIPPTTNRQKPASSIQYPASVVLLVEDNPDMRAYIRDLLLPDYRVLEAVDGKEGLKRAKDAGPDLIISDVMMPGMDGFEFCEKIKTSEQTSHIPVILLTARASGESKLEGLETGADDYLTKPFDAAELRVRVRNLIEQRRRLRERFRRELIIRPSEVTATPMDEAFLTKVIAAVEAHIDDPAFETDDLAREAGVSRRHLNRKLRGLAGQSVREFIRSMRLKRAALLLQQKSGTVTEIAYAVGFQSIAHFAKVFREEFGVAPSAYKDDEDEV